MAILLGRADANAPARDQLPRRDSSNSKRARSAGVVTLKLLSAPSISSGRTPCRSIAIASSVTSTPAANGQAAPAIPDAVPVQEARTDGFNFKGNHFDVQSFSGLGAVPQWTPYIYQWSEDPSHYLVEKASSAGSAIWQLGVGDTIQLDGQRYTIFHVMRHVPNDDSAYPTLKSQGATVTWQTCESASANSDLAIWFAR